MTFIEQKIAVAVVIALAFAVYQFCVANPEVD